MDESPNVIDDKRDEDYLELRLSTRLLEDLMDLSVLCTNQDPGDF
jgi:hypothetical protein